MRRVVPHTCPSADRRARRRVANDDACMPVRVRLLRIVIAACFLLYRLVVAKDHGLCATPCAAPRARAGVELFGARWVWIERVRIPWRALCPCTACCCHLLRCSEVRERRRRGPRRWRRWSSPRRGPRGHGSLIRATGEMANNSGRPHRCCRHVACPGAAGRLCAEPCDELVVLEPAAPATADG